jgi:hypothetical protein
MTSTIKVNNIQNQCGANIINESSNTITIGASGDTIALASGASQTGFGREGSVNWQTGSIKTTTFTAVSGEGYFVDTSSGAVTANLPAGSPGAIVAFADYTRTFATHNLTIDPNGSEKIGGGSAGQEIALSSNGEAITLVYVDGTEGWINVQKATDTETGTLPAFIAATGGTVTTVCTNFKVHTFTGPGTFCVSSGGNSLGSNTVEYIVVAGGASGGGGYYGGGGGAGGFRFASSSLAPASYPAKPLAAPANLPVSAQGYPIAVGGGGATQSSPCNRGNSGAVSTFSTITSTGGGGGGVWGPVPSGNVPLRSGVAGGSGGGAGSNNSPAPTAGAAGTGGAGNTPPVSPAQGKDGGDGVTGASGSCSTAASAGGGGATACGGQGPAGPGGPGVGGVGGAGAGVPSAFGTSGVNCGSNYYFAGGGGGAGSSNTGNTGGLGGGGFGGRYTPSAPPSNDGQAGTVNTGGGGGGAINNCRNSGAGGSGIIRYKFQ